MLLGNWLHQIPVILAKVKYKKPQKALENCNFFLLKSVSTNCSDISVLCSIVIAQSYYKHSINLQWERHEIPLYVNSIGRKKKKQRGRTEIQRKKLSLPKATQKVCDIVRT